MRSTALFVPLLALGAIADIQNPAAPANNLMARSAEAPLAVRAAVPEANPVEFISLEKRQRRGGRRGSGSGLGEEDETNEEEQQEEEQQEQEEEQEDREEEEEEAREDAEEDREESAANVAISPLSVSVVLGVFGAAVFVLA